MESTVLTTSFVTLVCLFVFLEGFKCSEGAIFLYLLAGLLTQKGNMSY